MANPSNLPKADIEDYPSAQPALLNLLRHAIEASNYEKVEEIIWSNPRSLITLSDSATYLMAGPKYNACHIAARANQPDIMALILDTVSNISFIKKIYPNEADENLQDRVKHLVDSYLNTPDPRQGNTPLHYACRAGHYRVVRVLLTFEGCDTSLRNKAGQTPRESICAQKKDDTGEVQKKIREMLKCPLHLPMYRDQLKKRLMLAKRRKEAGEQDADISLSGLFIS